ncbi:uncharacterized protein LOC110118647 [Ceratitis capitata]|uniref:uncharacterized protein LOC110118647 n=1 Tax=Ceratitis capitata TaxID=7213 RepID=UPI000A113396|nr:uncharacterized protein LOC110118647 [Ceratitis capitata]
MGLQYYMEILKLPESFTSQHDNDPKYTTHVVRMWLAHHIKHTIEYTRMWEELDWLVKKRAVSTKEELKLILVEEWQNIVVETTLKLVSSMQKCLGAVIEHEKDLATKH